MFKKGHPKYPCSLDVNIPKEQLSKLYCKDKKEVVEIATICNCSVSCIYVRFQKYNIKLRKLVINDEQLSRLYSKERKSLVQTASYFNCGATTIARHLKKLGIKSRKPSDYKMSSKTKLKISLSKKDRPNNSPTKFKKNDVRLIGKNNPAWRGGVTSLNHKIRNSTESDLWKKLVLSRDNWTCQSCGKRGGNLEVHHIKSFKKYPKLRFDIINGITYCKKCHSEIDIYRRIK